MSTFVPATECTSYPLYVTDNNGESRDLIDRLDIAAEFDYSKPVRAQSLGLHERFVVKHTNVKPAFQI